MPLAGSPPAYTRGYSFTQHSIDQPNVPQPGDKLDQEFDDIATALGATTHALDQITNPDGTLADGIVGLTQLVPGLFDQILVDAQDQLEPLVDAAAASAAAALNWAADAQGSAASAAANANTAAGAIADTQLARAEAIAASNVASQAEDDAQDWAEAAENSATTSSAAMEQSLAHKDLAFKWAEYLAGPVEPAPPGWPEAIDDGLWSAKWWALRAGEIVGDWGSLYLGAFPSAPPMPPDYVWPPGTLYYDTTDGQMKVWDGAGWRPITTPVAASMTAYVYLATNAQSVFGGADMRGASPPIPVPLPSDVHLNGVRLVEDTGNGTGDYTIQAAAGTVTIKVPLGSGSVVQWDILANPASAPPGAVNALKLHDIDRDPVTNTPGEFDGVTTNFPLRYTSPVDATVKPATPGAGVQLQVVLDGVLQEAGPDYLTSVSEIVFAQPPPAGTRFSGVWWAAGAVA
jgi:hypothetical protein